MFLLLFSFLVICSYPFSSISVSLCLLDWAFLFCFSSFFFCFFISFVLSFGSCLLASHCWEVIALSVSLMYFKSFFKLIISSFVKQVTFISLVFVFSFFLLAYFYCLILLFSIALIYPTLFIFACTSVQLSCLRFPEHTKASFFPKYHFFKLLF